MRAQILLTLAQLVRFLVVGLANTLVGGAVILLSMLLFGMSAWAANLLGYGVGLAISFQGNNRWTFKRQDGGRPLLAFLAAFAVAYAVNLALLLALIHLFAVEPLLAQLPAIAAYTLTFFVLCKLFVFLPARNRRLRETGDAEPVAARAAE